MRTSISAAYSAIKTSSPEWAAGRGLLSEGIYPGQIPEDGRDRPLAGTGNLPPVVVRLPVAGRYFNAAFFDKTGDAYTFEIYAPDFEFRIVDAVPA